VILCAGLSPAWQHTLHFSRFEQGEVNRAKSSSWCASGKAVNVASAFASLGVEHRLLTVVGGWPELAFRNELEAVGVKSDLIRIESGTRVCTTLLTAGGPTTELVEECGPISEAELQEFEAGHHSNAKAAQVIVIAGSISKCVDSTLWRRMLERTTTPAILDIRGEELLEALVTKPLLVKPNRKELASTLGRALNDELDVIQAAEELRTRGAHWVLITDGARPALLVGEKSYRVHSSQVKAVNPIGCGDTLAAGIAWRISTGESMPEAVRWGVAAAAANAETELPARFHRERVQELVGCVRIEKV